MMSSEEAWQILNGADLLFDEARVRTAVEGLATQITERLSDRWPLVLSVMARSRMFSSSRTLPGKE